MVNQYQSSHFYTFMQHLGSWIKFLPCLGLHTDLCLYGKWLTTAANSNCIVSGYFSSYNMNKRMLTTLPPPPCPPCTQVIFPKSHAKVLSRYCACCWCLSHLGALLLFPALWPSSADIAASPGAVRGLYSETDVGAGFAAGWNPGQRAEPSLLSDLEKGVGSTVVGRELSL